MALDVPLTGQTASAMTKAPYYYETQIRWQNKLRGLAATGNLKPIVVSSPPELGGESGLWTPEQLLLAAAESCLMSAFLSVAKKDHLPICSYSSSALARLDHVERQGLRFTKLRIRPVVEVGAQDRERAGRVMELAKNNCFVTNALNFAVEIEPRFVARHEQASAGLNGGGRLEAMNNGMLGEEESHQPPGGAR